MKPHAAARERGVEPIEVESVARERHRRRAQAQRRQRRERPRIGRRLDRDRVARVAEHARGDREALRRAGGDHHVVGVGLDARARHALDQRAPQALVAAPVAVVVEGGSALRERARSASCGTPRAGRARRRGSGARSGPRPRARCSRRAPPANARAASIAREKTGSKGRSSGLGVRPTRARVASRGAEHERAAADRRLGQAEHLELAVGRRDRLAVQARAPSRARGSARASRPARAGRPRSRGAGRRRSARPPARAPCVRSGSACRAGYARGLAGSNPIRTGQ